MQVGRSSTQTAAMWLAMRRYSIWAHTAQFSMNTMKAVRVHEFGGVENLEIESIPKPTPAPDEALVRVRAAGVNPIDWKTREGNGADVELPWTVGWDFSGTVEEIGDQVTSVQPGDDVYAMVAGQAGTYAEYITVPSYNLAPKPASLSHTEAAAVPLVSLTAWQALFDEAGLGPDQRVLIHAVAGGVGHVALQLANWIGTFIIGTASAPNRKFLSELGLDEFVEYNENKFEDVVDRVDVVLDGVGGHVFDRSAEIINSGGHIARLVGPLSDAELELVESRGATASYPLVYWRPDQIRAISHLLDLGILNPHLDSVFPLEDVASAHRLSQTGHTRGKIVLQIDD